MALRNFIKNSVKLSSLVRKNVMNIEAQSRLLSTEMPALNNNKKEIDVVFVKPDGERIKVKGKIGDSLLDVVIQNSLDFNGFGACEGTLTCSTCHIILKQEDFDQLPDKPAGEECDMLDMAYATTPTSRLGCQIVLTEKLDGIELQVPVGVNDMRDS